MFSIITLLSVLGGYCVSNAQAQAPLTVNLTPFIVQKISEASRLQAYPNTAGTSNNFFVSAQGGEHPADNPGGGIPLSNRIHTILAFQGIPPTASNCELHVNIPLKTLFSQRSTSTSGAIQNGWMPQMYLYQLAMPTSQSKGWTWDIFTQLQPTNANNFGLITGVFLTQTTSQLIYKMPSCPGPSGPMGGAAGFIFGMADDIPFISADVYLEQDYSDPGNIAGFYMKYTW